RWIDFGLLSFQPSELIKFTFVLFLAKWFANDRDKALSFFRGILFPLLVFGLLSLMIMLQPDMGTVVVLVLAMIFLFFMVGVKLGYLLFLGGIGVLAGLSLAVAAPYRLRRLIAFLDPWKDPQGAGFQIIQSLLAVGSGGLWGLGLGASRQKFFYLPQQFTDFIFAILCEELGFLGGATVVVLFFIFSVRGLKIALEAKDAFKSFLATGIVGWLVSQALINILVVLGLIPTTGVPLPFISYGGTASVVNLFASGIILNISKKER
ncbi:MAG: FtsW/RodA/SpoVE family cell cycle protein, partial [Candidatus Margulisiibacteriota bacterium]